MPYDKFLADRLQSLLKNRKGFSQKELFGGVGFLLNGNMCVGVYKAFLILRLDTLIRGTPYLIQENRMKKLLFICLQGGFLRTRER